LTRVEVEVTPQPLDADVTVVGDFGFADAAAFRGDENHTVARTGAVDGLCGGVFQNLDRFDVLGTQRAEFGGVRR